MKRWIFLVFWTLTAVTLGYGEPVVNSFGGVLFPAGKTTIELRELSIVLAQQGERMWADGRYGFYNSELGYVYCAPIRFRKGRNTVRLSYGFLPSRDSTGVGGRIYYPFTISQAGLWASPAIGTLSLRIKMEEGSRFTVPRDLGTTAAGNPWRLTGEGKTSRSDLTQGSDSELLYVYLKNGALEPVRDNYTVGRDLMIQIYNPMDHVEPLKSIYRRVFNGQGLEQYTPKDLRIARNTLFALHGCRFESRDLLQHFSRYFWYDPDPEATSIWTAGPATRTPGSHPTAAVPR